MAALERLTVGCVFAVLALALAGLSGGCGETGKAGASVAPVKISGRTFHLEVAADDTVRITGLGQRKHIEDDGGMIFVFPGKEKELEFVMRDCVISQP